ncbi:hypothetical protein [Kitasatospora sp. NPDC051914]|uniref:hypothetical protein n=1 Tax=Kitasatospora sp. NPDC051914 TaxID=3154945 RepID=UPI0034160AAA
MTCADYRAAASAQLDGEAPATDGGPHCADCADWLAAAHRLQALTRAAPGPTEDWTRQLLGSLGIATGGGGTGGSGTDKSSHEGS